NAGEYHVTASAELFHIGCSRFFPLIFVVVVCKLDQYSRMPVDWIGYGYAIVVATGGIIGYMKAGRVLREMESERSEAVGKPGSVTVPAKVSESPKHCTQQDHYLVDQRTGSGTATLDDHVDNQWTGSGTVRTVGGSLLSYKTPEADDQQYHVTDCRTTLWNFVRGWCIPDVSESKKSMFITWNLRDSDSSDGNKISELMEINASWVDGRNKFTHVFENIPGLPLATEENCLKKSASAVQRLFFFFFFYSVCFILL
ncbi:hypothetical protein NFI96_024148, partial [Prochilodus magdalenae]